MAESIPMTWGIRKWFWSRWQTLRFSLAKPQKIGPPKPNNQRISAVPLVEAHGRIPVEKVLVFDRLPNERPPSGCACTSPLGSS
jgi:hypothetical protein